jgi:hypothetical protein
LILKRIEGVNQEKPMKYQIYRHHLIQLISGTALLLGAAALRAETPHIFWASDPVRPDETVLVQGSEFEGAKVEVQQLGRDKKWSDIPIAQGSESSLKFIVPANWQQGVYALRVTGKDGKASKEWLINSPDVWWTQGDEGESATPGGWLRAFGKSLNFGGKSSLRLTDQSGKTHLVDAEKADAFAASFEIPSDLAPGTYQAAMHNGLGGDAAWREIANVRIDPPVQWPQEVFSVLDFYGSKAVEEAIKSRQRYQPFMDRMEGIRAALAKAKANGGGIVYFPPGKYLITERLDIPPRTVIRGAGQNMSLLWWGEKGLENKFYADVNEDPKKAGELLGLKQVDALRGSDYGIENIGLFVPFAYKEAISATGRFRMNKVLVRVDRGWLLKGNEAMEYSPASYLIKPKSNYQITDCDLMASKTAIWSGRTSTEVGRYGVVVGNTIAANTCFISYGSAREMILEDNRFLATAPRTYLNITGYARHIYYARNEHESPYGPQAISHFTSDLSGAAFAGRDCKVEGIRVTLSFDPDLPHWKNWRTTAGWTRPMVVIQDGRGAGQWREVASFDGRDVVLERPFEVEPDSDSFLFLLPGVARWIMDGNSYKNYDWVVPGYDIGVDVICANTKTWNMTEMLNYGGERQEGLLTGSHGNQEMLSGWPGEPDPVTGLRPVRPYSPSWYVQYLDNEFYEGNSWIRTSGGWSNRGPAPVTRCTVHRRHLLAEDNFGTIIISNKGNLDVIVEDCELRSPHSTISVVNSERVLLRNNRLAAPGMTGYTGSGLKDALILPPLKP